MRVRHPGVSSVGTMPGTCTSARTRRRYAVGGSPTLRAKRVLKLPRLEKPTAMQTSVTECCPMARRCLAASRRVWMRNWCGVTPKTASNWRMKWKGEIALRERAPRWRGKARTVLAKGRAPAEASEAFMSQQHRQHQCNSRPFVSRPSKRADVAGPLQCQVVIVDAKKQEEAVSCVARSGLIKEGCSWAPHSCRHSRTVPGALHVR